MKKNNIITSVFTLLMVGIVSFIFSCVDNEELSVYEYPEPTVEGVSPTVGVPGTQVTITGSDFGNYKGAVTVFFNEVATSQDDIVSVADNQIVTIVPAGASTGVVMVKVWTHTKPIATEFTVLPSAKFTSLEPVSGAPGDEVTITGENFGTDANQVSVFFKDNVTANVVSVSDTEIKVTVPDDGITGPITVEIGDQSFETTEFAYPLIGLDFLFDVDGDAEGWVTTNNSTNEVSGGSMNVSFDMTASQRRADFRLEGGVTVNVGGFPYLAIKLNKPSTGNFTLDTNFGSYKNGGNNWEGIIHGDIYYYDLRNTFGASNQLSLTEDTEFTTFQFKIADIVSDETGYSVDWVKSFPSLEELQAFTALEPGHYIHEFANDRLVTPAEKDIWIGRLNDPATTTIIEDGYLKVTFGSPSDGSTKVRADMNYSHGGEWGNIGSGISQDPWVYDPAYPIYAIKIHFVNPDGTLGGARPGTGTVRYDRLGNFNDDYIGDNVLWVDGRNTYPDPHTEGSWWAIVIADILSPETGYWVDWHRTFKSTEELEAFLASN